MRTALRAALMAAICLLMSTTALAEGEIDFNYSGPLDSLTGEPMTSPISSETASDRVRLSASMYYDSDRRMFAYPIGDGVSEVFANVADGMIVTEPVSVSADDGVTVTIYYNGDALEGTEQGSIHGIGQYIVSAKSGGSTENLFDFQIVGTETSLPNGYSMPDGFYILDATLDGEETYFDRTYIDMAEEGLYHVSYICPGTGLHYELDTTIDRTPPEITLDGRLDEEGRFHSAVDVLGVQSGDTVSMTYNDVSTRYPQDGHLADSGYYALQVADSAGNTVTRQFTIMVYFDLNSLIFFALVCVSLAGVLGYMLYTRRHLKVI